ncbi:bifunctional methylenetetrahydrofolate dehydrogenase/methenyltetrahydrofolate cyclohydrolase FolD [Rhizobium ruizarguesonis]|uniref:bifunctional methylenetetrahydrofolate dehydrogenase/methenyltetrahydrofolate cyclohydrolase FolD n=1 Tax=Rhizobium ruizarguesonis TaxID=2081791 RepID=UPI001031AF49|nr:bifunctional methylenetetrahydrofolate dehydrogenase/methenyltetrahydrofolate cyclohydrolase FolD [Rhizobium ruizarguesonis]TBD82752.1 bifunctional methylenetetrahydrofolate dehydrogenase/methenyltetrahydrofolate cyclohydrolase FolD [Rhizobium ruizarguesonis]TBE13909.1 bifunctional methylenetetrahydrofolate dehydrogenase/methenyltetrahydrofolate cyclohydrolase FolD [Rhizobium ruizarguesonis]TBE25123.1 bifunctional methylenetetrahydrofolate dehydrogenase/methenyltetrahydrofolate cyclohydrolase
MVSFSKVLSGKVVAEGILDAVKEHTGRLAKLGVRPGLAVVIVGEDPASQVYVTSKGKKAEECGFHSVKHELAATVTDAELLQVIDNLNNDSAINGILVQLPLPAHLDADKVIQSISPSKDVDGFHYVNVGMLGTGAVDKAFVPCTPAGCMVLIESVLGKDLSGLNAVVIGRSNIVGKPMANLLTAANATVTLAHSRTRDLPKVSREADIVVAAVGRPRMVKSDWIKPGALVIDVGINRLPGDPHTSAKWKLVGDVDFDSAIESAGTITPVPGGVGPMTIAMLMANTLKAAYAASGLAQPDLLPTEQRKVTS